MSPFAGSVCRGGAFGSLLKSAENRKRVAFPFVAASAAHFPSITAETHAGERRVGARNWAALPHKRAGRRVNKAVTVTGWSLLKWSADSWNRLRLWIRPPRGEANEIFSAAACSARWRVLAQLLEAVRRTRRFQLPSVLAGRLFVVASVCILFSY